VIRILFWLVAWILFGCACGVSLLGDAQENCSRIESAISAYEGRCHHRFRGELADCSELWAANITEGSAEDCEATLRAASCELAELPSECALEGL